MSPEDNQLLNFIATTVETLRARLDEVGEQLVTRFDLANLREQVATKVDLANLREQMQNDLASLREQMATKADLAALREELRAEMATKDDLSLVATTVRGDFEQVHLRFDTLERAMTTKFGQVETDISRIRSVLYLLVKDKPDMLRLLGPPMPGEARPQG
jgi:hypothetical protein